PRPRAPAAGRLRRTGRRRSRGRARRCPCGRRPPGRPPFGTARRGRGAAPSRRSAPRVAAPSRETRCRRTPALASAAPVRSSLVSDEHHFLLQRAQPAMVGLIDGSLSTLAPIFGIVFYTHHPHAAFVAGLSTSIGAAISMAFSEGLSDTGELTGRGNPMLRGSITGVGTFLGGILHTLPFLITNYHAAVIAAVIVVAFELLALAVLRWRFFETSFVRSLLAVSIGGAVIAVVGALIGSTA